MVGRYGFNKIETLLSFYNEKIREGVKRCEAMDRVRMFELLEEWKGKTTDEALINKINKMVEYLNDNPLKKTKEKLR